MYVLGELHAEPLLRPVRQHLHLNLQPGDEPRVNRIDQDRKCGSTGDKIAGANRLFPDAKHVLVGHSVNV